MSSNHQPTFLNIGCLWQYFFPMSTVLHVNLTSFFKFSCCFNEDQHHNLYYWYYFSGCNLQILYVKFLINQFDKVKESITALCIICVLFYHKASFNRNGCSFSQNHGRTVNPDMTIFLYSIKLLYITHDVQRFSQKFVSF